MPTVIGDIFQVLAVLIVIIVIFFLAWYIPHLIAGKGNFAPKGKNLAILEKIPVSKESYIMLLKTFDTVLVVGVTPGGMTTLREIGEGEYDPEEVQTGTQSFSQIFKTVLDNSIPQGKVRDTIDKLTHRKKAGGGDDE